MNRFRLIILLATVCLILATAAAAASDRDMELPGNWFSGRVDWRTSLGLPVDSEFSEPLSASYNWAYGSTLLGVNVREFGTTRYYAAVAGYKDDYLDIYDSEGPQRDAAIMRSGRYHVTAGLADGRIICWLTAPGEFPRRQVLATNYLSGSGYDVIVEPPDPPSSRWSDWTLLVCYQQANVGNDVATDVFDGEGRLLYDLPALQVDGRVRQLEYTRNPVPGLDMPWLLLSMEYGSGQGGDNLRAAVGSAWFVPGEQWFRQSIRPSSRFNSSLYLDEGAAGGALAMMAWDDSVEGSNGGFIDRLHIRSGNTRQVITDKGLPNLFRYYSSTANWCFAQTAANRYPYVAFSNGSDILFGYNAAKRGQEGEDVGYRIFNLMQGSVVSDDAGNSGPLYQIEGVAMATHWSTGAPQVFYIQNGSPDYQGGQLYQMQYTRPGEKSGSS